MRCNDHLKLPKPIKLDMLRCVKIDMNNEESYIIKEGDLVGIQFIKDDKLILVRKGRIKDIVVINERCVTNGGKSEGGITHASHIVLDCSEQFSVKIIEIKFTDIIKIGGIDDKFDDYTDRITELKPNCIEDNKFPVREHGLVTKEEIKDKKSAITRKGLAVTK